MAIRMAHHCATLTAISGAHGGANAKQMWRGGAGMPSSAFFKLPIVFLFLLDIAQLGLMVAEVINCPFPYFPIPYGCWYSTVRTRFYTIWPVLHLKSTMRLLKIK